MYLTDYVQNLQDQPRSKIIRDFPQALIAHTRLLSTEDATTMPQVTTRKLQVILLCTFLKKEKKEFVGNGEPFVLSLQPQPRNNGQDTLI
jgi:hypothetical protein